MEQGIFEGRRGSKRLKAIEKQKQQIYGEFQNEYENSQEMKFLKEAVRWEGTAELLFAMAIRDVHFAWNGLRDFGFLRLCKKWIEEQEETVMTPEAVTEMTKAILPKEMCETLEEELADLEIF